METQYHMKQGHAYAENDTIVLKFIRAELLLEKMRSKIPGAGPSPETSIAICCKAASMEEQYIYSGFILSPGT